MHYVFVQCEAQSTSHTVPLLPFLPQYFDVFRRAVSGVMDCKMKKRRKCDIKHLDLVNILGELSILSAQQE